MKSKMMAFLFGGLLVLSLAAAEKKQGITLADFRNHAMPELLARKSVDMTYRATGADQLVSAIRIRAVAPDHVRLDITTGKETICMALCGKQSWYYDENEGFVLLNRDEHISLRRDAELLRIPIKATTLYEPFRKLPDEKIGEIPCLVSETRTRGSKNGFSMKIYQDAKTLSSLRIERKDAEGTYVTSFSNFKTVVRVNMPAEIRFFSPEGSCTLVLQSASWNAPIGEDIFRKPGKITAVKSIAVERKKVSSAAETRLKKTIGRLEIEIKAKEEELKKMEELYSLNRTEVDKLAQNTTQPRRLNWYRHYGYGRVRVSSSSRYARNAKKLVKKREAENDAILKAYEKLKEELLRKKLQLSDAKSELEGLCAR